MATDLQIRRFIEGISEVTKLVLPIVVGSHEKLHRQQAIDAKSTKGPVTAVPFVCRTVNRRVFVRVSVKFSEKGAAEPVKTFGKCDCQIISGVRY